MHQNYWGKPVSGFGDPAASVLVLGLAPGAHGANRTGRMFTGDPASTWLMRAMHAHGFASKDDSVAADDGLTLTGAFITSPLKCAPPKNRGTSEEFDACREHLLSEFRLLNRVEVVVALGTVAWKSYHRVLRLLGHPYPTPMARFGHLRVVDDGIPHTLIGCYHPSQLNTSTGRLTRDMLDEVFAEAARRVKGAPRVTSP